MAATSRSARNTMELYTSKRWKHTAPENSPERTRVWTEPPNGKPKSERKVAVVYYLSRNGQLEHPHFMEVPLSSPEGLYLRDVINRLNFLRGIGLASLYSWSAKRSYKNGFVWHDLSENDFIYPAHGQEYVLKGSELMDGALISPSEELGFSSSVPLLPDVRKSGEYPVTARRRNQSWSSSDFHEYRVYKAESTGESSGRAADASTQTDDKRRRRRPGRVVEEEEEGKEGKTQTPVRSQSTELSRGEISPPPSDSSPETLETLMKADGRLVLRSEPAGEDPITAATKGKPKSPSVLLQLLSCGSISFRDCGAGHGKDHGFSLISHYKARLPRASAAGGGNHVDKDAENAMVEFPVKLKLEDKEYFSGSLIETKKEEFPGLKRSSSYNAERSSKLELTQQEIDGVRAKCIPRKPKTQVDTSQHGSKRMAPQS
nr:protein UPSTREAM OF FLC [Ipomoea batatas]GMD18918.1 protein UPSTREAM OF FLC [Ipomoea batatas]GME10117.1 protein UPSTREAM OF FLC [Ipomoea batatas]